MSGLAAAIRFDGGPAPRDLLQRLVDAAPHRAPDGCTTWIGSGAALARLHRLSLPEQTVAAQPLVERAGPHVLLFDGRLDNRDELAARFPGAALQPDDDDARYALAAIAAAGDDGVALLEGDFALLAWNTASRTAIAARDAMGVRPLHWMEDAGVLLVASDIAQLLAAATIEPGPDRSAIVELLLSEPPVDGRTIFEGVRRVPQGSVLRVDGSGSRTRSYWKPQAGAPESGRGDDDYAEECRALLDRAVRRRLRSRTPIAVFFSGGIDSSSVLAAALRVAPPAATLVPLSIDFRDPESAERIYRDAFTAAYGIRTTELEPDAMDPAAYAEQAVRRRLPPDPPGLFIAQRMRREAAARGARVALTGEGGDLLFAGTPYRYADLIRAGRIGGAIAQYVSDWRRGPISGWSPAGLLAHGVWPLLPQLCRERLRGSMARFKESRHGESWVRGRLPPRSAVPDPPRGVPISSWAMAWELNRGWTWQTIEMLERDAAEWQIELAHPLYDRRLIEFALRLPAPLDTRDTKATLTVCGRRLLESLGGRRFFERLALADAGWIDAAGLLRDYDYVKRASLPGDIAAEILLSRLWMVADLELWMRGGLHVGSPGTAAAAGGRA